MPALDVTFVLNDPDLADGFNVRRNAETVGADGRVILTSELIEGLLGVITWDTGKTDRAADAQSSPETIDIITGFSLRDSAQGWQPDVVIWSSAEYTVISSSPYRHFGEGFTKAKCVSTRAMDRPAPE